MPSELPRKESFGRQEQASGTSAAEMLSILLLINRIIRWPQDVRKFLRNARSILIGVAFPEESTGRACAN